MRKPGKFLKWLLLSSCIFLLSFGSTKEDKNKVTNWMNKDYIKCLERKLPCECEKEIVTYFVMHLDTIHSTIIMRRYEDLIEEETYEIKGEAKNSYKIMDSNKVNTVIGKIIIKRNRLFLYGMANKVVVFDCYGTSEFSNVIEYTKENISLLNKAFLKRRLDSLETILNVKSLNCHCNNDLGKMNFVWSDNDSLKSWILEMRADSLQISTIVKKDSDIGDSIFTKKVVRYNWCDRVKK
jgi:mRNA degradation ribonuclease J1/J2